MTGLTLRRALRADIPAIVALLADDEHGRQREVAPDDPRYREAFAAMERSDDNLQYVFREGDGDEEQIIGCAQMTILVGLSHAGMKRALIEGVRIAGARRGQGLGRGMIRALVALAAERGCGLVQLTSNARRIDARRFYESLGFEASHTGFKLALPR